MRKILVMDIGLKILLLKMNMMEMSNEIWRRRVEQMKKMEDRNVERNREGKVEEGEI